MAFRNIGRFILGDGTAKAINFAVLIYLARILGVEAYGTLEFALAIAAYLQFGADAGFELWGMRALAQGRPVNDVAGPVVAIRLVLSLSGGALLLGLAWLLPPFPGLWWLVAGLALRVLIQAFDLRWIFMAREQMRAVSVALVAGSVAFAVLVVALVREPASVWWVPLAQAAAHLLMVLLFWHRLHREPGTRVHLRWPDWHSSVAPALTMGASRALALLSYNFDSIVIGFLLTARDVGFYGAAYRPLAGVLAASSAYFLGLFPALARAHGEGATPFRLLLGRSIHLMALVAIPVAAGGVMLADQILSTLVGPEYQAGAPALRLLAGSAALVLLRGSFRQGLCAAGHQRADLWCAVAATTVNVALNLWWIPVWGIEGAAAATLTSEAIWLASVVIVTRRIVGPLHWAWLKSVGPASLVAGAALALQLPGGEVVRWTTAGLLYAGVLFVTGDAWLRPRPRITPGPC